MILTVESIAELGLPPGKSDKIFFDEGLPGFGIRFRVGGRKTWLVQYATAGRSRRVTIGSAAVLTLVAARAEAKKLLAAVALGRDPATEKRSAPQQTLEHRVTQKPMALLAAGAEPACYLYRHYHPGGDLLYVGISLEPLRRQNSHVKRASWRDMICRILIEPFATREEALAAEELAIRSEFPKFNITHNNKRHPLQEMARRGAGGE
jgi:Arm DNA-binding domain